MFFEVLLSYSRFFFLSFALINYGYTNSSSCYCLMKIINGELKRWQCTVLILAKLIRFIRLQPAPFTRDPNHLSATREDKILPAVSRDLLHSLPTKRRRTIGRFLSIYLFFCLHASYFLVISLFIPVVKFTHFGVMAESETNRRKVVLAVDASEHSKRALDCK